MQQLHWLPAHPDLSAAISQAKRIDDPLQRLHEAARLATFQRDFTLTARMDNLAATGIEQHAAAARLTPLRVALQYSPTVVTQLRALRLARLHTHLSRPLPVAPFALYH